jgi:hypothetical protein
MGEPEAVLTVGRVRRAARRVAGGAVVRARDLRLLPGSAAPEGSVPDFEAAGARVLAVETDGGDPRTQPPQTVQPPDAEFERVAAGPWRARRGRVAALSSGRLVTSEGLALTRDGRLVEETFWDADHRRRSELWRHRLPPVLRVGGTRASITSLWSGNYFHWLLDALPRIALLEDAGVAHHPLVVPAALSGFQIESLDLLGYGAGQLTPFAGGQLEPDVLVWPSPAAHIGYPTTANVEWLRRRLACSPPGEPRRLYVSRGRAATRGVVNEAELVAALEPHGFEVVRPDELSFREQVALFASAEVVVGPHGAGLSNMVFARDASVCELLHPGRRNACFYRLASASGHDYWYVLAEASGSQMDVPCAGVVATVERMCGARARRVAVEGV